MYHNNYNVSGVHHCCVLYTSIYHVRGHLMTVSESVVRAPITVDFICVNVVAMFVLLPVTMVTILNTGN